MADLNSLLGLGRLDKFSKNQLVFMQHEAGSNMYLVLQGTFGVYINSFSDFPVRVAGITTGSSFGEMALVDGSPRSATIISEEDSAVLVVDRDHFEELLKKNPNIADGILNTLKNRADATAEAVRAAGKTLPGDPLIEEAARTGDVKSDVTLMTALAAKIRQMNDCLVAVEDIPKRPVEKSGPRDRVKLLPQGYVPFHQNDDNDNSENLRAFEVSCPYCGTRSVAWVPQFSNLIKSRSMLDGRIIYRNFDILCYTNVICPNCSYADTYSEFTKPASGDIQIEYQGNQFENEENFTGYLTKRNHSLDEAIMSYYLNIECLTRVTNAPLRFAKAWIRLYWLYSDNGNNSLAKQSAEQAHSYYKAYLNQNAGFISYEDKLRLHAILGELSVVLGDDEQALGYYSRNVVPERSGLPNDLITECKRRYIQISRGQSGVPR